MIYCCIDDTAMELYSTKQQAIAAAPKLMDKGQESIYGFDWRNGLKGLGREDKENYLEVEDFRTTVKDSGLIFRLDTYDETCKVSLHKFSVTW